MFRGNIVPKDVNALDILQIRYFRAVAETGSFTRAAEALHMTQSALSRSIAKLEAELGLRLFERDGNRITLNRFGERFLHDSTAVLSSFSDCVAAVREMAGLEQGDVTVGISKDVFIDHLIRRFLIDHPGVSFHCYLLTPAQMRDALENGSVDFVLTTLEPLGDNIVWQDLYADQLEVMIGVCHPLAGAKSLHLDQLRNERFVVTNSNYNMENIVQHLCLQAGFRPGILYEGTSTDMPMHFIASGSAVMITPHSITVGVQTAIPPNDRIVNIPLINEYPNMQKTIRAAFREGHYQSYAAQAFYDRVVQFFGSIDA